MSLVYLIFSLLVPVDARPCSDVYRTQGRQLNKGAEVAAKQDPDYVNMTESAVHLARTLLKWTAGAAVHLDRTLLKWTAGAQWRVPSDEPALAKLLVTGVEGHVTESSARAKDWRTKQWLKRGGKAEGQCKAGTEASSVRPDRNIGATAATAAAAVRKRCAERPSGCEAQVDGLIHRRPPAPAGSLPYGASDDKWLMRPRAQAEIQSHSPTGTPHELNTTYCSSPKADRTRRVAKDGIAEYSSDRHPIHVFATKNSDMHATADQSDKKVCEERRYEAAADFYESPSKRFDPIGKDGLFQSGSIGQGQDEHAKQCVTGPAMNT